MGRRVKVVGGLPHPAAVSWSQRWWAFSAFGWRCRSRDAAARSVTCRRIRRRSAPSRTSTSAPKAPGSSIRARRIWPVPMWLSPSRSAACSDRSRTFPAQAVSRETSREGSRVRQPSSALVRAGKLGPVADFVTKMKKKPSADNANTSTGCSFSIGLPSQPGRR